MAKYKIYISYISPTLMCYCLSQDTTHLNLQFAVLSREKKIYLRYEWNSHYLLRKVMH